MKTRNLVCVLAALSACGVSACDNDTLGDAISEACRAASVCTAGEWKCADDGYKVCEEDDRGCTSWGEIKDCPENKTCNAAKKQCVDKDAPVICDDECSEGQHQCSGEKIQYCEKNSDGCLVWGKASSCDDQMTCDTDKNDCVESEEPPTETCQNECAEGDRQCSGEQIQYCEKNDSDCLVWGKAKDCEGENMYCHAESKACIEKGTEPQPGECENQCVENETQCSGEQIQTCFRNDKGCYEWGEAADCEGENMVCSTAAKGCVEKGSEPEPGLCENPCTEGQRQCSDGGIQECEKDDNGCFVWSAVKSCGSNSTCDPEKNQCVEGCKDACTAGETACDGAMIKTCVKDEQSTCTVWGTSESCGENSHCDAASSKCVNECVDECTSGAVVCVGTQYKTCGNFDGDSCLEFSAPLDCETNQACDSSLNKCVQTVCDTECTVGEKQCNAAQTGIEVCEAISGSSCNHFVASKTCGSNEKCESSDNNASCVSTIVNICEVGAKKCSDDGKSLMTCKANDKGNEWTSTACSGSQTCDSNKHACVSTCTNACTEGAKQCSSETQTQVCKKGANGCTSWVNDATCSSPKHCSAGSCQYYCGSDCDPWSIIILPDTQNYTRYSASDDYSNSIYHQQMKWILSNTNSTMVPNLKMVVHMGDITNNNTDIQWKVAKDAHKILKDKKVPFALATGNHDYRVDGAVGGRSKTKFGTYFGEDYLKTLPGFGGVYSTANTYFNFRAGGQDYLLLNLEYAPRQQTLCWANDLLRKAENENKKVIVATHANITHNGGYGGKPSVEFVADGARGKEMWTQFTSRHSNMLMVLNGHVGDSEVNIGTGTNKNTVYQILTDYQFEMPCSGSKISGCTNNCAHKLHGGNGWLRILTFDPKTNKVKVKTHSVMTGKKANFTEEKKDAFFCSELYKGTSTSYDNWYPKTATDPVHQYEFSFDFTTPGKNVYKPGNNYTFIDRVINSNGSGDQINSSVAAAPNGKFIVVWEDDSSDADKLQHDGKTNAHDIYGRLMNAGGCNISGKSEIVISTNTAGHQADPDVAMDKEGNFVVVWTDDNDNNGSTQVYMRGFNSDGSERFGVKTVNSVSTRDQYQPRIAMAPDGQFAVSWTDTRSSASTPQIWVRGFNINGAQTFAERAITDSVAGTQVKSDIFMDSSHRVVVVWEDDSDANGSTQVHMRLLNADGTSKTGVKTVNSVATGNQDGPAISGKQDGSEFIVTWTDIASKSATTYKIMGRTFNASGAQITADFVMSTEAVKNQNSQVCMTNDGKAAVAWYNPTKKDVMRRIFASGAPSGTAESRVNSNNNSGNTYGGRSYQPAITCIPGVNYSITSWSDDSDGNSYNEIYAIGQSM